MMFIDFGKGKCPICGSNSKTIEKDVFVCVSCKATFNNFSLSPVCNPEPKEQYWN